MFIKKSMYVYFYSVVLLSVTAEDPFSTSSFSAPTIPFSVLNNISSTVAQDPLFPVLSKTLKSKVEGLKNSIENPFPHFSAILKSKLAQFKHSDFLNRFLDHSKTEPNVFSGHPNMLYRYDLYDPRRFEEFQSDNYKDLDWYVEKYIRKNILLDDELQHVRFLVDTASEEINAYAHTDKQVIVLSTPIYEMIRHALTYYGKGILHLKFKGMKATMSPETLLAMVNSVLDHELQHLRQNRLYRCIQDIPKISIFMEADADRGVNNDPHTLKGALRFHQLNHARECYLSSDPRILNVIKRKREELSSLNSNPVGNLLAKLWSFIFGSPEFKDEFDIRNSIFKENSSQIYDEVTGERHTSKINPFDESDHYYRGLPSHPNTAQRIEYFENRLRDLEKAGRTSDPHEVILEFPNLPNAQQVILN